MVWASASTISAAAGDGHQRNKLFAVGLAVVVLAFAAISITVVVMTST